MMRKALFSGDGSTLSLDFTTGVLDPRLTFTRSTNATFINSQGYVQFADANMFVNSAWAGANETGWTLAASTGSLVRVNETRQLTCAAQQYWWYQQPASRSGLTYSVSVEVTAVSGSMVYGDIILAGSSTYIAWYKDGVLQAGGTSTTVTTGVITLIFTANSDNTILRLGLGSAGTNVTGSVTLRYPQFQQGRVPLRSYYENTSTSVARFNSARFDYDPTTLTARGLLIEASASNLTKYSQDLNQVSGVNQWYGAAFNTPTVPGSPPTDPFGGTTSSWKLVATAGSAYHAWRFNATYTDADYTFSFWARAAEYDSIVLSDVGNGRGGCRFVLTGNGTATVISRVITPTNPRITPYPGGWYRCEVTMTMTAALYGIGIAGYPSVTNPDAFGASYNADGTSGVFATAVQAELGSVASSYIPTGASTGTRATDLCVMTGTNFSSWFNSSEGTFTIIFETIYAGNTTLSSYPLAFDSSGSKRILYLPTGLETVASYDGTTIVTPSGDATGAVVNVASAYSATDRAVVLNGGTVATGTIDAGYTTATSLGIGASFPFITIKQIKYYPTRLTNAQMQGLTT
jgi:hypothetical protein